MSNNIGAALPRVAVVSVTYNRCEPLLVLLGQLEALDYDPTRLDVFLVDNASADDTVARVEAEFPTVKLIRNEENTGVSAGFNRSVQAALDSDGDYKYLWLLDSDAEIEPHTLVSMVTAMERDNQIGVVGSAVYDPLQRARLVTAGLRVDWRRADLPFVLPNPNEHRQLLDVDLVPACSMLTRASLYQRIGLWDERFPLYWGDTDWCARVLASGARVCCDIDSRAWHRDWATSTRAFGGGIFIRDHVRGALLFYLRHDPAASIAGTRRLLLKTCVKAALERLTLRQSYSLAYWAAVSDVLRGHFEPEFARADAAPPARELDTLVGELALALPPAPRILLNQIGDAGQRIAIKEAFDRHIEGIRWHEIAVEEPQASEWLEYRIFKPGQLLRHLRRMAGSLGRVDLNVCEVSRPLLCSLLAGRRTLLLDGGGRGIIEPAAPLTGLATATVLIVRGLKAAYVDLPRALRECRPLREAVATNSTR